MEKETNICWKKTKVPFDGSGGQEEKGLFGKSLTNIKI